MYLGETPRQFTQAEIDNYIAWQSAQPADAFLMGAARTVGEYWKNSGATRADLEQLARDALANAEFRTSVGIAMEKPWENPNWPAVTAAWFAEQERQRQEALAYERLHPEITVGPGPITTTTRTPTTTTPTRTTPTPTASVPATREQVLYVFRNTPGANPQPDEAAISYYMGKGVAQLVADIAAIRKSNPALAAQIDAQRKAMGLPTATSATTITPSTTATGGTTALLLAAAAAYLLGS